MPIISACVEGIDSVFPLFHAFWQVNQTGLKDLKAFHKQWTHEHTSWPPVRPASQRQRILYHLAHTYRQRQHRHTLSGCSQSENTSMFAQLKPAFAGVDECAGHARAKGGRRGQRNERKAVGREKTTRMQIKYSSLHPRHYYLYVRYEIIILATDIVRTMQGMCICNCKSGKDRYSSSHFTNLNPQPHTRTTVYRHNNVHLKSHKTMNLFDCFL